MNAPAPHAPDELERLRAELRAAQDALGDFAYTVSHDLRAQLRHINAYSGLLREELGAGLSGDSAFFLDTISNAAQLMGRQIEGLTAWAQLDRATLEPVVLDTASLVGEVRQTLATADAGRGIDWRVAPDLPPLRGDGVLLRQLFTHLLSNAFKFTRRTASPRIEIGWQAGAQAGWCGLHVRDNGAGFDPRHAGKLFHVFQRLHAASEFEGLGLGLALAHKIVTRHGGTIQAEGAPGAGCCVRLTLPSA